MLKSIECIHENDIIVLHGCCHNPTGADLNTDQWVQIADVISKKI